MKTRFIRINDISEIETSSTTVYDLNNRYIDARGNMFGLRYNRDSKKIEVIKIIRTPAQKSSYFQQQLVRHRRMKSANGEHEAVGSQRAEDAGHVAAGGEDAPETEDVFESEQYISQAMETMKTHRDRIAGIMMNIKNSHVVPETERGEANVLIQIFRSLEIDGIKRIEKVLDNHKEIVSYPRSLSYYESKLDNKGRDVFEAIGDYEKRMKFVFHFEMFNSIKNLYNALFKGLKDLDYFLQDKKIDEVKGITLPEKQCYLDATTSLANTLRESGKIMRDIAKLEEYVYNRNNFSR
ncbi:MAG: hypothetical protein EPN93_19020 [Spirochaetes bacterium]|nr:MAG: hypothetical protein EPN93_19020 [Spirochaetota bacterium]